MSQKKKVIGVGGFIILALLGCAAPSAPTQAVTTDLPPAPTVTEAPTEAPLVETEAPTQASQVAATVLTAAGDEVAATVDEYRAIFGADNGGAPASDLTTGYREINWDGVPDELAAPNYLPADFFNSDAEPRARGAFFSTPGEGIQVSAKAENPSGTLPRFGNINPGYQDVFQLFSEERLFSPIGSNIVDLTFYVSGTSVKAAVRGFGAIYTDVDTDHTAFEYFDANDQSLGSFATPISDNGLSFLGVAFPDAIVARVRITYGTSALGPDDSASYDVAVMDNFIYGEPQALP